jgi:hypothetical protein
MGFEPTISAFERAKTVDALQRAASVTGFLNINVSYFSAFTPHVYTIAINVDSTPCLSTTHFRGVTPYHGEEV